VVIRGNTSNVAHPLRIDNPPEVGDPPHLDIEATLREMHLTMQMLQGSSEKGSADSIVEDKEFVDLIAKKVSRKNVLGKALMWAAGIIGTIFSAGMAYQVFIGANATDDEVVEVVHEAFVQHNGGKDPDSTNGDGIPIGHHPTMKTSIQKLNNDTAQVKVDVGVIKTAQKKAEKRGEYQYEFSRWQGEVMECERTRRCRPPKKPEKLKELESDIHLGKFD